MGPVPRTHAVGSSNEWHGFHELVLYQLSGHLLVTIEYVDSQWFHNRFQFKIQWEGFVEEHNTWENADDIDSREGPCLLQEGDNDFDLEEDFYKRHPNAPKRTDLLSARTKPTQHRRVCK